jgi:hypothetical protein
LNSCRRARSQRAPGKVVFTTYNTGALAGATPQGALRMPPDIGN